MENVKDYITRPNLNKHFSSIKVESLHCKIPIVPFKRDYYKHLKIYKDKEIYPL